MGIAGSVGLTGRAVRVLDVLAIVWVAVWAVLGVLIGLEVRQLAVLNDTVIEAGRAVEATGNALEPLERLPFIGESIAGLAEQVREAGARARTRGEAGRRSVERLSVWLGVTIAVVPSLPPLALYGALRVSWSRDRRAVRRMLRRAVEDATMQEYLARRALRHLRFDELREITSTPWADLEEGRYEALAAAELERLRLLRFWHTARLMARGPVG